jgi:hypothetical protein
MMRSALLVSVVLLCGLTLAGCGGSSRSILMSGVSPPGPVGPKTVINDATARQQAREIEKGWLSDIAVRAREDPSAHFANLPTARVRQLLAAAGHRYGFTVKTVRFLRPRQLARLVVVETTHYEALARAFGRFDKSLNPLRDRRTDGLAGVFEGFFFEAQDERGVPFFLTHDAIRGVSGGGGQWARADALYPAAHG